MDFSPRSTSPMKLMFVDELEHPRHSRQA